MADPIPDPAPAPAPNPAPTPSPKWWRPLLDAAKNLAVSKWPWLAAVLGFAGWQAVARYAPAAEAAKLTLPPSINVPSVAASSSPILIAAETNCGEVSWLADDGLKLVEIANGNAALRLGNPSADGRFLVIAAAPGGKPGSLVIAKTWVNVGAADPNPVPPPGPRPNPPPGPRPPPDTGNLRGLAKTTFAQVSAITEPNRAKHVRALVEELQALLGDGNGAGPIFQVGTPTELDGLVLESFQRAVAEAHAEWTSARAAIRADVRLAAERTAAGPREWAAILRDVIAGLEAVR